MTNEPTAICKERKKKYYENYYFSAKAQFGRERCVHSWINEEFIQFNFFCTNIDFLLVGEPVRVGIYTCLWQS